jgi:hypothetical protein
VTTHLRWTAAALGPAVAIVVAAVGLSLIVAGATLVCKRIQIVNDTVLMLVMIVSASALPLFRVPGWWSAASHAFPVTDGVGSLYNVMLAHRSVSSAWGIGGLVPLLGISAAYLLVAVGAFILGERVAKSRGSLGRY